MLKIYYKDEKGNKIFIPENTEDQPKGEIKFKFKENIQPLYWKKVQLPNAMVYLDNNCQRLCCTKLFLRASSAI